MAPTTRPRRADRLRPSFASMIGRACTFRCPVCGGWRAWFRRWFAKHEHCRTCGFAWRRGSDGFETGSMTINFILTFGVLAVALAVGIASTYPRTEPGPLLAVILPIAFLLPVALFPFTYLLWSAIELTMHPLDAAEFEALPATVRSSIAEANT